MKQTSVKPRKVYKLEEGSLHEQFLTSRKKVRLFGGGFANGKTTALVILTLQMCEAYPGGNFLLARSTYPKLNDTLKKVFLEWCPPHWIKSFPKTENICTLQDGTTINFRYIDQKAQSDGNESSSNLLSATYDFIGVDQVEDPEIEEKDFDDLLGRLRGDTPYVGDDPTMPKSGPRWIALTCNPTRNWVYKVLVQPLQQHRKGKSNDKLMVDKQGEPLIDLIEGSTYTNAANLAPDYIETLEAKYRGQMKDRYLNGEWAAYEGLVYPQYNEDVHVLPYGDMMDYFEKLMDDGYDVKAIEGYDYGIAASSCYLNGYVDHRGNVMVCHGFCLPEYGIDMQAKDIFKMRQKLFITREAQILADPSIFRRSTPTLSSQLKGRSIAEIFETDFNIKMRRGNNDIVNGITKVSMYLNTMQFHRHPITGNWESPRLYFADTLSFIGDEMGAYYWKKASNNDPVDKPKDGKDHALDTIKYMLSDRPEISIVRQQQSVMPKLIQGWAEREDQVKDVRNHRHG